MRDKERSDYERLIKLTILESLATAKVGPEEEARIVAVVHDFIVQTAITQIRRIGSNAADADDVAQETLTTMLRWLRSGRLHRVRNVAAFLTTVALRRAIDMKRGRRHVRQVPDATWTRLANQLRSEAEDPPTDADASCTSLADLPGMSALTLQLIELRAEGLTWAQVALRLRERGWSFEPRALRVRWHRLRPYFDRRRDDLRARLGPDRSG